MQLFKATETLMGGLIEQGRVYEGAIVFHPSKSGGYDLNVVLWIPEKQQWRVAELIHFTPGERI